MTSPFEQSDSAETTHPAGIRRAKLTWACDIEPEPVVWAWKENDLGRIPAGALAISAGREGTGKSSFGIWMASQLSRGTLLGSHYGNPMKSLYVAIEDSWKYTLVPRLMAAKADRGMIARFEVVTTTDDDREVSLMLSLPSDNELLKKTIIEHNIALVVIDPLMSVIGDHLNANHTREVRQALDPLARIADDTGAVIHGIAHFNKSSGTDAAALISGSGAFKDVPRAVFGFARDYENQSRIMSQVKNSLGRDDLPSRTYTIESIEIDTKKGIANTGRFAFTGETDRTVADVLRESRSDAEGKRMPADQFIAAYLHGAGGEAPVNEVIAAGEARGYKEGTLKNARPKVADTYSEGFTHKTHFWVLRANPSSSSEDHARGKVGPTSDEPLPTTVETESNEADTGNEIGAPRESENGLTDRVIQVLANAKMPTETVVW